MRFLLRNQSWNSPDGRGSNTGLDPMQTSFSKNRFSSCRISVVTSLKPLSPRPGVRVGSRAKLNHRDLRGDHLSFRFDYGFEIRCLGDFDHLLGDWLSNRVFLGSHLSFHDRFADRIFFIAILRYGLVSCFFDGFVAIQSLHDGLTKNDLLFAFECFLNRFVDDLLSLALLGLPNWFIRRDLLFLGNRLIFPAGNLDRFLLVNRCGNDLVSSLSKRRCRARNHR